MMPTIQAWLLDSNQGVTKKSKPGGWELFSNQQNSSKFLSSQRQSVTKEKIPVQWGGKGVGGGQGEGLGKWGRKEMQGGRRANKY